jgi:homoserine kinase
MRVTVSVPATSANLGPGFDTIGLALDVRDVVTAQLSDNPGVRVTVHGNGSGVLPTDESHLVAEVITATADSLGHEIVGLDIECHNSIPQGRGMGSSASAIIAGLVLARELFGTDIDNTELLRRANVIEGHADNISACLLGGMTVAWWSSLADVRAVSLPVHADVRALLAVPNLELSTSQARGMLSDQVAFSAAVHNLSRTATLIAAMTVDPSLLLSGTDDQLHQEDRRPAYPQSMGLVDVLRAQGLAAVISGAGPTVLVLGTQAEVDRAAPLVSAHGFQPMHTGISPDGAYVVAPGGAA